MNTNKAWKKAAAFAMALALMGGVIGIMGSSAGGIKASAESSDTILVETFTVTVDSSIRGGTVTVDKEEAPAGDTVTAKATANDGYRFVQLTVNGVQVAMNDQDVHAFVMPAENAVISAEFAAESEVDKFTVLTPENGSLTADFTDETETTVKIEAVPDQGYDLAKVMVNGEQVAINDQGEYLVAYSEDMQISAEFVKKAATAHTITVQAPKNGTVTVDKQSAAADEAVLITATPASGFKLDKVLMNGQQVAVNDKDQYLIAMPDEDITVTAEFVADAAVPSKQDSSPKTGAAFGITAATAIAAGALIFFKKK